jgi:hypothetical protein
MRWVRDLTGRFPRRPHYATDELEEVCEDLLREVRRVRPQPTVGAISSDDLTVLIERRAADLDLYADLGVEGADVEGVTDFAPGLRPCVRIRRDLSEDPRRGHRLRTTLAHELAHVVLHNFIWWFDQGTLDATRASALSPRCHRRRVFGPADWMEWQAAYASGALLMPRETLRTALDDAGRGSPPFVRSTPGRERLRRAQRTFDVSAEAASVRLLQLGYVSPRPRGVARAPVPAAFRARNTTS